MAEPGSLVGKTYAETYQVVRLIGKGGMGSIYEAHHARLHGKRYAIKVLAPQFAENPELLTRFRREAEIASQLGHENIVEVHDFNVAEGRAYMVMELLEGEDLAARLKSRGPMTLEQTAHILEQVASGLEAAHRAHVVHRDLKPQNVFLCRRGGRDDYVKVLDFGVSKVLDSSSVVTRENVLVGTPFYMSPEQAEGRVKEIDARTDVFALGAIAWEMLTGRMAFGAPTFSVAIYKVCFVDPPDVHLVRPDVPPAVSMVLRRAMAKERSLRTSTVAEFAGELAAALQGVMPESVPPPAPEGTGSVPGIVAPPMHNVAGSLAVAGTSPASPPPMASAAPAPSYHSQPSPPPTAPAAPPTQGRGKLIALVAAIVVLGGAAGAGLWLTLGRGEPGPVAPPTTPAAQPAPAPTVPTPTPVAAPQAPADVAIDFTVEPSDVTVEIRLDGETVADRHVRVARSDKRRTVTAEAKGYPTWKGHVVPDQDRTVAIALKKKAPKAPQPAASPEPMPYPPVNPAPPELPPSATGPPVAQPQPAPPPPQPEKPKKRTGTIFDDQDQ